MVGRKPVPYIVKQLEGNPGHRKLEPPAVQEPDAPCPKCPAWLGKHAKAEWRRLAPLLHSLKLLTPMSAVIFAAYCDSAGQMIEARKTLDKEGETFTTDKGYIGPHPAVAKLQRAKEMVNRLGAEFGLSQLARMRLKISDTEKPKGGSTLNGNWAV